MNEIINSITTAITLAKRLKEISNNIQDAEFKNLLADLSLELADTKLRLSEIVVENSDLKEEISRLKHSQGLKSDLKFKDGLYYTEDGDGPFCPGCYDSKGEIIRTPEQMGHSRNFGTFKCPKCHEFYQ
ncbi:MAG: hypothetical protein MRJ67_09320 [Nitrospirales bacterium]|nr:hypothetical protein [Nitrospira sp.]MDR4460699.1 hypothetical protein [Nitrospirales bacterium]MDR4481830.1 hypothetical protein [Nitrospirales bacterium]